MNRSAVIAIAGLVIGALALAIALHSSREIETPRTRPISTSSSTADTAYSEAAYFEEFDTNSGWDVPPADGDPASFDFIGGVGEGPDDYWAKDKNHVYDNGIVVDSANPKTFTGVYNQFGYLVCVRDRTHLWFFSSYSVSVQGQPVIATGGYCKTDQYVLMGDDVVASADARAFVGLNDTNFGGYGKDKDQVYYDGFSVAGADASTFKILPVTFSNSMSTDNDEFIDAQDVNYAFVSGTLVF